MANLYKNQKLKTFICKFKQTKILSSPQKFNLNMLIQNFKKKSFSIVRIPTIHFYLIIVGMIFLFSIGCSIKTYHNKTVDAIKNKHWKQYTVKERIFTLNQFVIKDESNIPIYRIKRKMLSIGDKLSVQDLNGNELLYISQKLFNFKPRYKILKEKKIVATVVKNILSVKPSYIIDIPGPNDYKIIGDFSQYEYTINHNEKDVAYISKHFYSNTDSYTIAVKPDENDILILVAVVIIDLITYQEKTFDSDN